VTVVSWSPVNRKKRHTAFSAPLLARYSRNTSPFIVVFAYPFNSTLFFSLCHTVSISPPRLLTCRHLSVEEAS
jgi:hypothetical protein